MLIGQLESGGRSEFLCCAYLAKDGTRVQIPFNLLEGIMSFPPRLTVEAESWPFCPRRLNLPRGLILVGFRYPSSVPTIFVSKRSTNPLPSHMEMNACLSFEGEERIVRIEDASLKRSHSLSPALANVEIRVARIRIATGTLNCPKPQGE